MKHRTSLAWTLLIISSTLAAAAGCFNDWKQKPAVNRPADGGEPVPLDGGGGGGGGDSNTTPDAGDGPSRPSDAPLPGDSAVLPPRDMGSPPDMLSCAPGTHPCDNRCVDDKAVATCGTSCEACPAIRGGTATCDGMKCGVACPTGTKPCLGECIPEARSCVGACPTGTHDCQGVCADNRSVNSCGTTACAPCPAPAGARATCDGTRCDFVCETGKRCTPTATTCVTGCCSNADCMAPARQVGTCNTATNTCSFRCADEYKPCGSDCIPRAGCCDDCPGDFNCVNNTCSTTACRTGYKRCGAGCVPNAACCPSAEVCFNGMDDDCDGNVDCADTDCGPAAMCVPTASAGFAIGVQVPANQACPAGYTASSKVVNRNLTAPNDCTGCSCTHVATRCRPVGQAHGTTCDSDPVGSFRDAGGNCVTYSGPQFQAVHVSWYEPVTTCAANPPGSTGARRPTAWAESFKFCERVGSMTGGGCPGGQICVARTSAKPCALAAGNLGCPAPYASSHNWYAGLSDTRQCSACQCALGGGACPSVDGEESARIYFNGSCSRNGAYRYVDSAPPGGYCTPGSTNTEASIVYLGTPTPATCTLQPSSVISGAATPTEPQTYCCLP